jgi:murein tripeptide amidase MpaA
VESIGTTILALSHTRTLAHSHTRTQQDLSLIQTRYVESIGTTIQGRNIPAIIVTGTASGTKKNILVTSYDFYSFLKINYNLKSKKVKKAKKAKKVKKPKKAKKAKNNNNKRQMTNNNKQRTTNNEQ